MKQFKEYSLGCFLWSLDFCGIRENKLRSLSFFGYYEVELLFVWEKIIICC